MRVIDWQRAVARRPRAAAWGGPEYRYSWDVTVTARRGGAVVPVILVIVLATAALGLEPGTAQVCSTLEDFPCGP